MKDAIHGRCEIREEEHDQNPDLTCVNQASRTVNLRNDSKMYKDITNKQFNKQVVDLSSKARVRVALYIAKIPCVCERWNHKDFIFF
jgi:hypothetical protein